MLEGEAAVDVPGSASAQPSAEAPYGPRPAAVPRPETAVPADGTTVAPVFDLQGGSAWYGAKQALAGIRLSVPPRAVTALIGPSGCGKSTLLRCLNRMHEVVPGARVEGR